MGKDFVDIALSKTQRKTPTEIHKQYHISRIRAFYMRKVKYTQQTYNERLTLILSQFPRLDDIHPFYADLINVLYDRDHFKVALSQVRNVKHIVDQLGRDYVRLLKYGDSLYRCKCLKRACLGRMTTAIQKIGSSLAYLEQVRQHLGRLPSIDPSARTLLISGFPNVGKSSFVNLVTRADVEVQPYAFTTRSLYVGHTDYQYHRWQVIDTPGILDHALEERNTIEMQSVTALAHLHAVILYFVDLSGTCGYNMTQQASLFDSLRPLFGDKPLVIVANKTDLVSPETAAPEDKKILDSMVESSGAPLLCMSTKLKEGVLDVKAKACDLLFEYRKHHQKSLKKGSGSNRAYVAVPEERDDVNRGPNVPESVLQERAALDSGMELDAKLLEKDLAEAEGRAYSPDLRKHFDLANPEEKYDIIPEIVDGMNVMDYVRPDIDAQLAALEEEELTLLAEEIAEDAALAQQKGFTLADGAMATVADIKKRVELIRVEAALKRTSSTHRAKSADERARTASFQARVGDRANKRKRAVSTSASAAPEEREQAKRRISRSASTVRRSMTPHFQIAELLGLLGHKTTCTD
eukprot:NODE_10_length_4238_cov_298.936500_g7_i0.p2 GENE.NODE_10_length_4238_cov_298.936500_g7_i0~~NODE_10_length_4238_cov_298.936500_g7_i0.p2  ORF type:complete len:579 (+),score=187.15 NODE_10_length_4238_cov_298.936500_g7_i0:398-2134(+)